MQSFDEFDRLHMSGARAVFITTMNSKLDKSALAEAFSKREMKLEVYEQVTRPRGGGLVLVDAGVT